MHSCLPNSWKGYLHLLLELIFTLIKKYLDLFLHVHSKNWKKGFNNYRIYVVPTMPTLMQKCGNMRARYLNKNYYDVLMKV